ncbi:MAG: class B sortase [Clostridia bacterium]|nr:class B sortase [Clostridia bacterium]
MGKLKNFYRKHERKAFYLLIAVFASVGIYSGGKIVIHKYQEKKAAESFSSLSQLVSEPQSTPETEEAPKTPREVYADVIAQNSDFVGWLEIEDTTLSYPVVQSEIHDYYLRRGFDKKYSYYGVPYATEICDVETSDNVVIFGHNMNNGTMFGTLEKYLSKSFYDEHKYIKFNTLEGFKTYEVIAVLKTVAYSETEFEYFRFESGTKEEFEQYVAKCKELSVLDIETTAEYGDKLITLSTCEYSQNHGRLAVVAKLVK